MLKIVRILVIFQDVFSTINSDCVHNQRVYISTESSTRKAVPRGRFYAVDVNYDADTADEILREAWYYPYLGRSQATPLFIDDTIYFDGYGPGWRFGNHPKIYALTLWSTNIISFFLFHIFNSMKCPKRQIGSNFLNNASDGFSPISNQRYPCNRLVKRKTPVKLYYFSFLISFM